MKKPDREWWAGQGEEYYTSGPYRFRTDAIDAGREDFEGDPFVIAEVTPGHIHLSADRVLDDQYFSADDLFDHDHCDPDWTTRDTAQTEAALTALQAALDGWLADFGHLLRQPNLFAETHTTEHFGESYSIEEDDDDDGDD